MGTKTSPPGLSIGMMGHRDKESLPTHKITHPDCWPLISQLCVPSSPVPMQSPPQTHPPLICLAQSDLFFVHPPFFQWIGVTHTQTHKTSLLFSFHFLWNSFCGLWGWWITMLMKQRLLFIRVCNWPLKMLGCVFNPGFLFSLVKVLRFGNFSFSDTSALSTVFCSKE